MTALAPLGCLFIAAGVFAVGITSIMITRTGHGTVDIAGGTTLIIGLLFFIGIVLITLSILGGENE